MAGSFDPNKDYAAAIKNESDPVKKQQLISERQNKIDAMNAAGTNKNNYTNDIYNKGSNSGNRGGSSGGKNGFNPNMDFAAAIRNEKDPVKQAQLIQERENKISWLDQTGQNKGGYTNDVYKNNGLAGSFAGTAGSTSNGGLNLSVDVPVHRKGQFQSADSVFSDREGQQQANGGAAMAEVQNDVPTSAVDAVNSTDYQQVLTEGMDPVQKAAMQAYYTRQKANIDPSEVQGVYAGDTSMSLPDQEKLKGYQKVYNDAKARGDKAAMDLAAKAAENLRDNYRYHPLANSDGFGMGENNLGFVRDVVVRVDSLGNKYVDEYGLNHVTTTQYDKDGNFVNRGVHQTDSHDDYVAKRWGKADEYGRDYMAVRVGDSADAQLSNNQLMAKYGMESGMGKALYTTDRINGRVANGMTGAGTPIGQKGATGAVANNGNSGYFDPDKDYAAAIKNATSTAEMLQLQQERENKLNWMDQNGQNPNGYTNQIYSNYQNIQSAPQGQQMMPQMAMPQYQGMTKEELYEGYNDAAANLESQRKALLNLTLQQSQAAQDTANAEYDNLARQAYILKRQQEMAMPQQLAALGISGGGSETANLKLQTNYQNNLNSNEVARQQMMKEYALQNLAAQTQANSDIAGYYADAQQNAMNAWQNEMANQNSWNQWAASYQQGLREYQDQLNNLTYDQLQANKQQQIDLALQLGDYNKLKALGYDTSYLQRLQDAELEQLALAAAKARSGSVRSGGTGGDDNSDRNYNPPAEMTITNQNNAEQVYVPGLRWVDREELDKMVDDGFVKEIVDGNKITYQKVW